ncbi:MAG TPA: sterol desaturase family protein [Myxococcota bacterium]|nr:sterol desaturase family protein [Myxococcota bacterium]
MPRHPIFTDALLDLALGDEVVLPPAAQGRGLRFAHQGWIEALTRAPWWSPYAVWLPALAAVIASAPRELGPGAIGLRLVIGVGWWTLAEYVLHRSVFHLPPITDVRKVVTFVLHRHHHRDPGALDRLAATPPQAASLLVPMALAGRAVDPAGWAWCAAGIIGAYVAYEALHYSHHHRRPRTALGRWLRERHLRHHHVDPTRNFGISSPLWDVALGTGLPAAR